MKRLMRKRATKPIWVLCLSLLAVPVLAQSRPKPQVSSCNRAAFRQFDYWLGSWTVFGPNQKKAADVKVTKTLDGCALVEEWTAAGPNGHDGRGMSTYNPATQKWEYFWVASNAYTSYWTGEFSGNAMRFTAVGLSPGAAAMRHWNMTLLPGGRIQEQALFSQDNGKTWKIQYTLYWERAK